MASIRHLRCNKNMSYKEKFLTKWTEEFRKQVGVYEDIVSLKKLFEQPKQVKKLIM